MFLAVFVALFLVCVIASTIHYSGKFLPLPVAQPGIAAVPLFNATLAITGVAFFLTHVLLFAFAYHFRARPQRTASFLPENLKLEFVWTIIPAISFLFLFIWGQRLWAQIIAAPSEKALEIEIVAEQFNWKVRYPGNDEKLGRAGFRFITNENNMGVDGSDPKVQDDFVPVQMHVPKDREIKLRLWSKDVIHSFYVPFFHTKMDAVPGMTTTTHFTPTATTEEMRVQLKDPDFNYEVACAELCGRMHFAMKLILVVDEPEDFERWSHQQTNLALKNANIDDK
jgi:cytochrome c oxidase subunit 2